MTRLRYAITLLAVSTLTMMSRAQGGFDPTLSLAQQAALAAPSTCSQMSLGANSNLNGFRPFPANDPWHQEVTNAMVDGNSDAIIAEIGPTAVHPDFGSTPPGTSTIGIPYQVVSGVAMAPVTYNQYGGQSDPGPMPIPSKLLIEGYPVIDPNSDNHALLLDRDNCFLFELWATAQAPNGSVTAGSGAVWDLLNNNARPYSWTSADAAGLPIFPGLVRYEEIKAGVINHAIRFTLKFTKAAMMSPATHWAQTNSYMYNGTMGMRMRLRADFDISKFSPQAKIILTAMKKYGLILADNGSSMYISGSPDPGWNNDDLHNLNLVNARDFEVLQEKQVFTDNNLPTGPAPTITSFTQVKIPTMKGVATSLMWKATGASYYIVSGVGPVRGNSVTVSPNRTTTYTLYATNQYGQTTSTVKVVVQ